LCAIPAGLAIPLFFFAGISAKNTQSKLIKMGAESKEYQKSKIKKNTMFVMKFG